MKDIRQVYRSAYWFEIFAAANFVVSYFVLRRVGVDALDLFHLTFLRIAPSILMQAGAGIIVRAIVARRRGGDYLRAIRTKLYLTDLARIAFGMVVMVHAYAWLKVAIPALHPRLYDQFLWDLDRTLCFGLSPNVFFVEVFSNPLAMRAVDWSYANVFIASIFVGGAWFLSEPDRDVRVRFVNANVTMWIIGAWLYLALPSVGPCYRFPDVWLPLQQALPQTQYLQGLLMKNRNAFEALLAGRPAQIDHFLGIAAFPSLHVAYVSLVWLSIRHRSYAGGIIFSAATIVIFIGSMVTGWHYFIDALAGLVLAVGCYAAFRNRAPRLPAHVPGD